MSIQPKYKTIKKLCVYFIFFNINYSLSQQIPQNFKNKVDSIVASTPQKYDTLNKKLNNVKYDTILLNYFLKISRKNNYLEGQSYALNHLGNKYRNTSQLQKGINHHKEALKIAKQANNVVLQLYSLNMLSLSYKYIDAIKTSLDYAQRALELGELEKEPNYQVKRNITFALNNIGNIYLSLKQYQIAIEKFNTSLKQDENIGNAIGLAVNNQNIGTCYEELGQLDLALKYYKKSYTYSSQINNDIGKLICNNYIAQVYIKQNKTIEAKKLLKTTLKEAQKANNNYLAASIYLNLGMAQIQLKEYKSAENHLLNGIFLAKEHNSPKSQVLGYSHLSELYSIKKDYKKSLQYYKKAKLIDETINNETNIKYVNDILFRYDTEKKNSQIEALARENERVRLELKKNENTILVSLLSLALLALILYILYRQFQLKSEKKLLTLEQTMLRSQMNPHFLFNSLNSIKLYIINNETKNAVYYLNKFSKLVRKILEASTLKEISLSDELETIELYMNIENIRFSNEIDFQIKVEKNIDTEHIKIPSLILQPFLENAIWHGLSSKIGEKKIRLDVFSKDDYFNIITITDNGIGRGASEVIKENKVLKRKSIGINITKERLYNFSKDYHNSFDVEIIDLYDNTDTPCGTKVVISLPTI
ncbi:tetratricopeptide repeat protein [Cellulophaga baltica]|uniref:tetratricopeptide repeat protein n=1 Tax=Cellulophaga TaxID=104264 RepID=UPI001C06F983|nr:MULTISPECIES: tetratricopeptide repeat protein [Cellulophaga]MBU2997640.1 tetratricopeptide repeat protein [Cellulophaga baltica]MDO6769035.1 tetratricopeptide repeat protein [Cellulophaga sp. 1_MG-2023]